MSHKNHRPSRGSRDHFDYVNQHLLEEGDKIPYLDSADEDSEDDDDDDDDEDDDDDVGDGGGGTSGNASDSEDDVMTESQENLAMAYVNRYRMPSLAERRNQEKLTVTIENERNPSVNVLAEEAKDKHTELKIIQERAVGLRRNSISMPTLTTDDLEALHQVRKDEQESKILVVETTSISTETTVTPSETPGTPISLKPMLQYEDESDEEKKPESPKHLFRSRRRGSIAPLPALRLNDKEMMANDFDTQSVLSNQNSITSVNSLASLLKEKMQNVPAMIRKKRRETKDYKLRVFVGMLFLIIVFLVGYAYIMYNQKLLAKSYFESVKLHKITRAFRILDPKGNDLLTGQLAVNSFIEKPYNCLPQDLRDDGSLCYEWNSMARLYMNLVKTVSPDIKCYSFSWQTLTDNYYPTDCFDIGEDRGYWYGGGLTNGIDYPLGKASFDFAPFITGDINVQQWGNAVKRYFLNSKGIAIRVDDRTPLYVSINNDSKNRFCLQGRNDNFAYANRLTKYPELTYQICTGPDMKTLHSALMQKSLWDGLTENDNTVIKSLLREPVWQIPAASQEELTETAIYNYTENVIVSGYLRLGHVLLNEFWQKHIGDFKLDSDRFPTLEDTVNILHRRGFRISLSIQPFISTESANFLETVSKKLLIHERESEQSIPALTRYKSLASAGVIDITNNETVSWLKDKLKKLTESIGIDSFYVDFGNAFSIPRYYQCSSMLENPDQYKTTFMNRFEGNLNIFGVSSAISVPRPPAFLSLPPVNSSWSGLQNIIPTLLAYGVIGFPFIMPGPVGGDFLLPTEKLAKMYSFYPLSSPPLPEVELYVRWLQLATFLPVLRFTHLPSEYKNDSVTEIAKELSNIRQQTVVPLLEKYSSVAMDDGLPIIRPLWMLDSTDVNCLFIDDEFSIGDGMIVAPILYRADTSREVYLPQGVWKDGIDGSLRKGSRWIHNYHVPANKVAYFVKMPDNTRF
ncbi:myogenesis-regulating glycosidase isoform X1 [Malaya genurostris]|uniref:myogenesis-regulating glycosidase isoform X1 n=3 Tax=Malaya genurostris TaxID=325434 RepID=UPI0026F3D3DA|nr:myogenesis-regulating glycosidase isoform X1 [Malaya genurostris]